MLTWASIVGCIFGPAALVFVVYLAAKTGHDTKQRPCTNDARPYDPRRLAWRK